jgi:hypothetical protein
MRGDNRMNYIWEAVTKKRLAGAELSDISFVPAQNFSPYTEVNTECLNESRIAADLRVEVNPFVRFNKIFASYMNPDFKEFPEYRAAIFDILMRLLLYTDKKSGYDRNDIERFFYKGVIAGGAYGEKIKAKFSRLAEEEKDAIADGLITLYRSGDVSIHLYCFVMRRLFPRMIPYLKIKGEMALLVYLGRAETEESEAAAVLCEDFFLPADLKVSYYFDRHFGIFGIDETMKLGETVFV